MLNRGKNVQMILEFKTAIKYREIMDFGYKENIMMMEIDQGWQHVSDKFFKTFTNVFEKHT